MASGGGHDLPGRGAAFRPEQGARPMGGPNLDPRGAEEGDERRPAPRMSAAAPVPRDRCPAIVAVAAVPVPASASAIGSTQQAAQASTAPVDVASAAQPTTASSRLSPRGAGGVSLTTSIDQPGLVATVGVTCNP